ncbi:MAG: NADH-quinone oxidoreductase subunit N [Bacteroidales bacterium]|jgi:NADH-quinone oxidoreductase subunit N
MLTIIALTVLGILILAEGILGKKSWHLPTILVGLLISLALNLTGWNQNIHYYNNMLIVDNSSIAFSVVLIFTTFIIFLFAGHYYKDVVRPLDDIYAILIFALTGSVLMTSFGNLIILFLGIETLSIALYVLAGSHKEAITSNEATLKYFLMGSFLSGFLLFGIALLYGASGSLNMNEISRYTLHEAGHLSTMFRAGLFLLIIGLAFKIAIVPFHFWAPDVYEGTPTLLTAFMATVVKVASIVALFRLFNNCFSSIREVWAPTIWILAVLTILVGNFTGLYQPNLKRMLAYSSISHSGYMMLAVLAFSSRSSGALLLYAAAYSVATVTAFGILILIRGVKGNDLYTSFEGISKKNPLEALCLTIALLSLAGIPPLAGFMAKYYLFSAALEQGYLWLLIIAVLGSAISIAYYFKPIISIYLKEGDGLKLEVEKAYKANIIFLSLLTLALGFLPALLINLL